MHVYARKINLLTTESALPALACPLFFLRAAFAYATKSPVAAAFESAVYAFSRAALRAACALSNALLYALLYALSNALLCARRVLFHADEGNARNRFSVPKNEQFRAKEKNESKKQKERKVAKEIIKKEIKERKESPLYIPPRGGRAGTIYIGGDFFKARQGMPYKQAPP